MDLLKLLENIYRISSTICLNHRIDYWRDRCRIIPWRSEAINFQVYWKYIIKLEKIFEILFILYNYVIILFSYWIRFTLLELSNTMFGWSEMSLALYNYQLVKFPGNLHIIIFVCIQQHSYFVIYSEYAWEANVIKFIFQINRPPNIYVHFIHE